MNTGIRAKKILLPKVEDLQKFSVIACDQFTSESEYWEELDKFVGDSPSALKLVYPEIYLEKDTENTIKNINANMRKYDSDGVFYQLEEGLILTVRSTPFVEKRIGIIAAVDLEEYDFKVGKKPLVRATEGTIEERIPPRVKIRKDAIMEFPHIMVLFDDKEKTIAEELYKKRDSLKKVYDFTLNMGGGKIEGYFIKDYEGVLEKFDRLLDSEVLIKKYGTDDKFQFAVGDGNHSLATAKTHWENVKKGLTEEEQKTHPARYCLAEFVNIYDDGIYFEPIFRFVDGVDKVDFIEKLEKIQGNFEIFDGENTIKKQADLSLPQTIRTLDAFIKEYLDENGGKIDYVHGEENLKKLVKDSKKAVGIFLPKMDKEELFKYVSQSGALPRKTFSMGEGVEKRYYLEGSYIVK